MNKDGLVKLDDVAALYDPSRHPDVASGKKTYDQVFLEYMSAWETQEKDGIVTFEEFVDYYKGVSANCDTDEIFAAVMKSAWKF